MKKEDTRRARRASRVRPVPVAQMRVPPTGIVQRRFNKSQAEEYAAHFDVDKFGIPVVNLRDGVYWLFDGQHRIAALKMFFAPSDPGSIECEVYEDLTDAEMAEMFRGRDERRAINSFEKFPVACTAGRQREGEVRRMVESNGLKVSRMAEPGCVGAVSSLLKIFDRSGSVVLGQTLRTLRDAFAGDAAAFDANALVGVGLVYGRYNGQVNERRLIAALGTKRGMHEILRAAESLRERTGNQKAPCVAATVVDIYNRGAKPSERIGSWWKERD